MPGTGSESESDTGRVVLKGKCKHIPLTAKNDTTVFLFFYSVLIAKSILHDNATLLRVEN